MYVASASWIEVSALLRGKPVKHSTHTIFTAHETHHRLGEKVVDGALVPLELRDVETTLILFKSCAVEEAGVVEVVHNLGISPVSEKGSYFF